MKQVTINEIAFRVSKHPLLQQLTKDDIASYAHQVLLKVGAPLAYEDKQDVLEVENNRAQLPCDLLYIKQVRGQASTGEYIYLRYNQGSFGQNVHASNSPDLYYTQTQYQYTVQGDVLYTNFDKGSLEIAYKRVPTDEDGYPLIPGDESLLSAIEYYIRWKTFEMLSDINQSLIPARNNAEKEYTWYIGQADTSLRNMTVDQLDTAFDPLIRILPRYDMHQNGFNTQNPENFNTN